MYTACVDPSANIGGTIDSWYNRRGKFSDLMIEDALTAKLRMGGGRGLYWRYFLGLLPAPPAQATSSDSDQDSNNDPNAIHFAPFLKASRKAFIDWEHAKKDAITPAQASQAAAHHAAAKKQKKGPRFGDESSDSESEDDKVPAAVGQAADNPLSGAESSSWTKYFQKQKVMELVDKDLGRLWSGVEFFENPTVKANLREILECLIDTVVVTDYCQGMHELLSIVYLVLALDAEAVSRLDKSAAHFAFLTDACSTQFVKHDAFAVTRQILTSKTNGMGIARWYEADPDCDDDRPVVKQSEAIQSTLLAAADPEVSKHMTKDLDIQAAAYGLRWLRLLFLREFPINQAASVWDALFADHAEGGRQPDPSRGMIPHFAVSMLLFIRADVLQDDYALVLRRLMRFPPVGTISVIVQRAVILRYGPASKFAKMCGTAKSLLDESTTDEDAEPQQQVTGTSFVMVNNGSVAQPPPAVRGTSPPSLFDAAPVTSALSAASPTSKGPTRREQEAGEALASVIDKMNSRWFPDPKAPAVDDTDYVMAIAELKRIRDVLLNGLPL